jgi:DNA-binding MarR family transcriptional regulator
MHSAVDSLHRLTELGLTRYEARAYLALITRESFTAAQLAAQTRIPRQRVYDVVNGLVARGLARQHPAAQEAVATFTATSPENAISALLAARREELASLSDRAESLAVTLHDTWSGSRGEDAPLEYVDVVRDPGMLAARFSDMRDSATEQLLVWAKAPFIAGDGAAGLEATRRIADSGGDVRCLYERSILDDERYVLETLAYLDAGEKARVVDSLPMKLCLTDGRAVLFSLTDTASQALTATNIFVEHPALVSSLTLSFESMWRSGRAFRSVLREHRAGR